MKLLSYERFELIIRWAKLNGIIRFATPYIIYISEHVFKTKLNHTGYAWRVTYAYNLVCVHQMSHGLINLIWAIQSTLKGEPRHVGSSSLSNSSRAVQNLDISVWLGKKFGSVLFSILLVRFNFSFLPKWLNFCFDYILVKFR